MAAAPPSHYGPLCPPGRHPFETRLVSHRSCSSLSPCCKRLASGPISWHLDQGGVHKCSLLACSDLLHTQTIPHTAIIRSHIHTPALQSFSAPPYHPDYSSQGALQEALLMGAWGFRALGDAHTVQRRTCAWVRRLESTLTGSATGRECEAGGASQNTPSKSLTVVKHG